MPVAAQSPVLHGVNGKLYFIGGLLIDNTHLQSVYEYDPVGNAWTPKTDMPTGREDMGSAVLNGKIHVFGGLTGPGNTRTLVHEVYDPATDTWDETKADLPAYKHLGDFGASDGTYLYAVGAANLITGYPSLTPVDTVYRYDPGADEWALLSAMPLPRCYKEVACVGGQLIVVSGCTDSTTTYTPTIYACTLATDSWAQLTDYPVAARGVGLAVYDGNVYACGGEINGQALKHFYRLGLSG